METTSAAAHAAPGPAIVRTVAELRARVSGWRRTGDRVALVPTMGALHDGHLSLVRIGFERAERVVVSIFVNPTQFAPNEDFQTYPRTEMRDMELLELLGTDLVFAPSAAEMYPPGFATRIETAGPALGLESDTRPHFFGGVATVVAKLLIAALPDIAVFGEKDYQQLAVVRRLAQDLGLPIEIVGAPTVREHDGLAMSSRNAYLSLEEREIAPVLHDVLMRTAAAIHGGTAPGEALEEGRRAILAAGFAALDYLDLRDAATLEPASALPVPGHPGRRLRLLVAARLGTTRLIDNCAV